MEQQNKDGQKVWFDPDYKKVARDVTKRRELYFDDTFPPIGKSLYFDPEQPYSGARTLAEPLPSCPATECVRCALIIYAISIRSRAEKL